MRRSVAVLAATAALGVGAVALSGDTPTTSTTSTTSTTLSTPVTTSSTTTTTAPTATTTVPTTSTTTIPEAFWQDTDTVDPARALAEAEAFCAAGVPLSQAEGDPIVLTAAFDYLCPTLRGIDAEFVASLTDAERQRLGMDSRPSNYLTAIRWCETYDDAAAAFREAGDTVALGILEKAAPYYCP